MINTLLHPVLSLNFKSIENKNPKVVTKEAKPQAFFYFYFYLIVCICMFVCVCRTLYVFVCIYVYWCVYECNGYNDVYLPE